MNIDNVSNSLMNNMNSIWSTVANFAPRFASALALLVVGYFIAKLVSKVVRLALNKAGIDNISQKVGLAELLVSWKLSPNLSHFIAKLTFTFIFLIFLVAS